MKKCFVVMLALSLLSSVGMAQRKIEQSFPAPKSQPIDLQFDDARLVQVKTWDRNEVSVRALVSINNGEHDHAFELQTDQTGDILKISSIIANESDIPRKHFIVTREGNRYLINNPDWNSAEVQEFIARHEGEGITARGSGILKEISIEVFVPANAQLNVYSKNGDIEIDNVTGPLTANSKNGAVDVTIPANGKYSYELRTRHGEIYTDLPIPPAKDFSMENVPNHDKWNVVAGQFNGGGTLLNLESKNGSIYLRKQRKM